MKLIKNADLAPYSTLRIGGPAEWLCEAKTKEELIEAVRWAKEKQLPFKILGSGSNLLIADSGVKGLVVKNSASEIKILKNNLVELDSGVFLPKAIFYLIGRGLTGLEVFAGIPATAGGATAVKMHGVGRLWEDFVISVRRFNGIILSVKLRLEAGDPAAALNRAKAIQRAKSLQPQRSAGCIFKNPRGQSAGAIIDKQLKLKGTKIGRAQISNDHANFIINLGGAKASDVLQLIKLIEHKAKDQLNLDLEREIILWEN